MYVNTTGEEKTIPVHRSKRGIISRASYDGVIKLKAYDADLIEWETLSSMRMHVAALCARKDREMPVRERTNERRMSEIK